jgi:hypothetical protein
MPASCQASQKTPPYFLKGKEVAFAFNATHISLRMGSRLGSYPYERDDRKVQKTNSKPHQRNMLDKNNT